MSEVRMGLQSVNGIKAKIVKGEQNRNSRSNIDANSMAQIEADRMKQQEIQKKQKIQSFMNNTRINASKIYKEQINKNITQMQNKKELLEKQKQLKAKYTIVPKKSQRDSDQHLLKLPKQPMQVNWKKAEQAFKKVYIPEQNCEEYEPQSNNQSGYDSEVDISRNETPEQVNATRAKIRKIMMQKFKKQ